jgi:lipopolysaccharide transport system ATP-binding protein
VLAVGDEAFQHKCIDRITRLRRSGVTILLVSHNLGVIESLCDRAIWFEDGRIVSKGNATDVVRDYLRQVAEDERASNPEVRQLSSMDTDDGEQPSTWGNRVIEITDVELYDAGGKSSVFTTGGPLEVRIYYRCNRPVNNPVFGLAIHHQNGTHVCGPNTQFGELSIPRLEGEGYLSYSVPTLSLLEGKYELTVAVVNEHMTETYHYHDRAYGFRVYRGNYREVFGVVTLKGEWSLCA